MSDRIVLSDQQSNTPKDTQFTIIHDEEIHQTLTTIIQLVKIANYFSSFQLINQQLAALFSLKCIAFRELKTL